MRVVASILLAAITGCGSVLAPPVPARPLRTIPPTAHDGVAVLRVVDGDTIVVALGGAAGTKVRLIGIDTPERDECLYASAAARMRALVGARSVKLVRDVSE